MIDELVRNMPSPEALNRQLQLAGEVLQPLLPIPDKKAPASTGDAIRDYIRQNESDTLLLSDIDTVLRKHVGGSQALERGVVGPTGASSTINFSVFGWIFGLWGIYAGLSIRGNSGQARDYLMKLDEALAQLQAELTRLLNSLASDPRLAANIEDLRQRISILEAFRDGVQTSISDQTFNRYFPGGIQFVSSMFIVTLAVDLAPTLHSGAALLPSAATAAFGIVAASALGIYAGGSMIYNGRHFVDALGVPRKQICDTESQLMKEYWEAYNKGVTAAQAFYGLNTISWAVYVAGAVGLVVALANAPFPHGAAVTMVVGGALAVVIWDAIWGELVAPHNAMAPHMDRNYLDTPEKRAVLFDLLRKERCDIEAVMHDILTLLPATHKENPNPANFWARIPKETRYKYFWQVVPGGKMRRFAKWAVEDAQLTDPPLRDYMLTYTGHEIDYLRNKLTASAAQLGARYRELTTVASSGHSPHGLSNLRRFLEQDCRVLRDETAKLAAMQSLYMQLQDLDISRARTEPAVTEQWNRLRLGYLSVHGMIDAFLQPKQVLRHPSWFRYEEHETRGLQVHDLHSGKVKLRFHRDKVTHKRLSERGYQKLAGCFSEDMERRFIRVAINLATNKYERATVFSLERGAMRTRAKKNPCPHGRTAGPAESGVVLAPAEASRGA
jgi:hypothetical protein